MSPEKKMPLKAFWEEVEKRLAECTADGLRSILRAMAERTTPGGRRAFVDMLAPVRAESAAKASHDDKGLEEDIASLIRNLKEKMEDPDATEAYDDYHRYHHGWHGDGYEDGPGFLDELSGLFDRAEAAFDYGNLTLARSAYGHLFEVFDLEDDFGRCITPHDLADVEMAEARARYLRAVYETATTKRRVVALFQEMLDTKPVAPGVRPTLDDIVQISVEPLPGQEEFLEEWTRFVRKQDGPDADAWLREAIRLGHGTRGLEELARTEGKGRPHAYLDWVVALAQEGKHREALSAAKEALEALPRELPIRAAIADQLCAAAERLNERESFTEGRWEAFDADPALARLLGVLEIAPGGEDGVNLMRRAAQRVKECLAAESRHREPSPQWPDETDTAMLRLVSESTLAHAHLLAGDWQAAHQLAVRKEVLGWSNDDNPQGLVVSTFLTRLSAKPFDAMPPNVRQVWEWALGYSMDPVLGIGEGDPREELLKRLMRAYAEHLPRIAWRRDQEKDMLSWCVDVAKKRVKEIVSNQHRGSYSKAAVLTVACAEVLRLREDQAAAESLLNDVRACYHRHSAFQRELKAAAGKGQ